MKRISIIFIMFLYLIPSIGFSVTVHYCGGKIASVSFFNEKGKCGCGNKKMKKDCCKDETTIYQLDNEQQKIQQCSFNFQQTKEFQPALNINEQTTYQSTFNPTTFYNCAHPPDEVKHPLYIQHRAFRI
ncbi:MAG: hypothetical protein POELPBGB_00794 [Bacteroidia bacterium]|nr:hypothetical protein [Bacteroidia bacterium]